MNLLDSAKQLLDHHLPKNHQLASVSLLCFLFTLSVVPEAEREQARTQPERVTIRLPQPAKGSPRPPQVLPTSPSSAGALPAAGQSASPAIPPSTPATEEAAAAKLKSETTVAPPDVIATEAVAVLPPETAPEPVVTQTPSAEPSYVTRVKPGDNLSLIFARAGLTPRDVYKVVNSGEEAKILNRLYPGYQLAFRLSEDKTLEQLEVVKSPQESYQFILNGEAGYDVRRNVREPEIRQTYKSATIKDSLFLSARRGGISAPLTMELAGIFGGVIDFILDPRAGDTFNVLYEEKYLDGKLIGNGAILGAQFTNRGRTFTALRYVNEAGDVDYYNPEGESMRKTFLRNPVDFTRISSGFNLSRRHPILNTIRAHKGTDYAAPNGTPVVAVANGRVTWAARNGSFGKLVVLQHDQRFETKYAHLSSYARGIKNGTRVKQGQVIGYVGATGSATGPHLHYEFLMDGVHRNWRTIHEKLPKAQSVAAAEMQRFRQKTLPLLARLETTEEGSALVQKTPATDQKLAQTRTDAATQ